jgi:hypothetical protein
MKPLGGRGVSGVEQREMGPGGFTDAERGPGKT